MIFYALKFIQFVVRELSKKRITIVTGRENKRNSKFVGGISGQKGADFFPKSAQVTIHNVGQVFDMCTHGECFI